MNKFLMSLCLAAASLHAVAAPNVGVSVHVDQPGVYGRIDIGNVPQPPVVVYSEPVIISRPPVVVDRRPIYLHVPPGHSKNWGRYCGRYSACGQPVYFVREDWYHRHYNERREWREERRDVREARRDRRDVREERRDRREERRDRHEERRDHHDRGHHHGH